MWNEADTSHTNMKKIGSQLNSTRQKNGRNFTFSKLRQQIRNWESLSGMKWKRFGKNARICEACLTHTAHTILIFCLMSCSIAQAHQINMEILAEIESGGNPIALSPDGCRGLYQISEIVLQQFKETHKGLSLPSDRAGWTIDVDSMSTERLFEKTPNEYIADWYLDWLDNALRINGIEPTVDNILIGYNFGLGHFLKWRQRGSKFSKLPKETQNYLKRYHILEKMP